MQPSYFHIITVHIPVILTPVLVVWIFSQFKNPQENSWKWIFVVAVFLAIITSVSYFTGPSTAEHIKTVLQDYPQDWVENHALWGRMAFVFQIFAGLVGIMGVSALAQDEKPSSKLRLILLILLIVTGILLLYTAHLGGMIRREDLL